MVDATRAQFDDSLTSDELAALVREPHLRVIQTSSPVRDSVWGALNTEFFSLRPDVELRVYGHYSKECDLSFVSRMTNVRRFAADSLRRARNIDRIAELHGLESLSLGIFELQNFEVLEHVTPDLNTLRIGPTRSRKPDLAPLARFASLRTIYIEGHSRNIEVLAGLPKLEDATLRSVTTPNLEYLRPLPNLWSLDIKLGGIRSLIGVEGKKSIKYLELWQIREFSEVDTITTLSGLQNLLLQSLPHIARIPPLSESQDLRRITLINLKGLTDLSELEWAPSLEEFAFIEANSQDPEQLIPVLRNPTVVGVTAGFGSNRKNKRFEALREEHGKAALKTDTDFQYR